MHAFQESELIFHDEFSSASVTEIWKNERGRNILYIISFPCWASWYQIKLVLQRSELVRQKCGPCKMQINILFIS